MFRDLVKPTNDSFLFNSKPLCISINIYNMCVPL